jgi:hyperpolarization activated cyclic nucleotide-gated potassium channel 2
MINKSKIFHHKCRIRRDSISHLPKLFPDASLRDRLKRKVKKLFLVSINHPEVFRYLKSNAAVEKESKRQVDKYPGFIIHPLSEFRKFWNILIFVLMFFDQMVTSFTIAFFIDMESSKIDALVIFDLIICSILLTEILLTFRTGYIVGETYEIILDSKIIARKYLKDLVIDFINCLPYVFFTTFILKSEDEATVNFPAFLYMCCLYAFSFYRFCRICFYFSAVPIMLNLSEKGTIILKLCLRTIYW